jgi:hypothetical protein
MLFNALGRWPAGAFRSNSFYIPLATLLAVAGLGWFVPSGVAWRRNIGLAFALLIALPVLYFRQGLLEKGLWTKPGTFTAALRQLPIREDGHKRTLLMDFESCRPWEYYATHDRPFRKTGKKLKAEYKSKCLRTAKTLSVELKRLAKQRDPFSLVITDPRKFDVLERAARTSCRKADVKYIDNRTHLVVNCVSGRPRPRQASKHKTG